MGHFDDGVILIAMDRPFGAHTVRLDGDLAWVTYRGDATLAEVRELCGHLQEAADEYGYVIVIIDSTAAGVLSAEGRRFMAGWLSSTLNQGIFIGASVIPRTMVAMVDSAAGQLSGKDRRPRYVTTVSEAQQLLPEIRADLCDQAARCKPPQS